jgi:hypothetical protein
MHSCLRSLLLARSLVLALEVGAVEVIPKPYVVAPECTQEQQRSALATIRTEQKTMACFAFEKWGFKGAALAFEAPEAQGDFQLHRRRLFRDQSARVRSERDMKDAIPGEPIAHSTIPTSLFIVNRTPLGIFIDETNYIGFADLVPIGLQDTRPLLPRMYPLLQLEIVLRRGTERFRLVLVSQISGTETIGQGYRIAEDWALSVLGQARPAWKQ